MIRHIVFVRFSAAAIDEEITAIFADLRDLQRVLPGMRTFSGGPNLSPEGLSKGYTHAFTADFDDAAARGAYLAHPAHQAAGARLVGSADGGIEGLLVIDVQI